MFSVFVFPAVTEYSFTDYLTYECSSKTKFSEAATALSLQLFVLFNW